MSPTPADEIRAAAKRLRDLAQPEPGVVMSVPVDLDAIEARVDAATAGPWDVHPHVHAAAGCRCLSCDDPVVGWSVDHPQALDCDDIVAERSGNGQVNGFGRPLASCGQGPLLSFEDAEFAAHARTDVPALIAEIRRLRATYEPA